MTKIVINKCFGGFGLSDKACERLIELGVKCTTYDKKGHMVDPSAKITKQKREDSLFGQEYYYHDNHEDRINPLLIQVVEELGREANGEFAELRVIEIPDDVEWEIDEYDGSESIEEKHRSWG